VGYWLDDAKRYAIEGEGPLLQSGTATCFRPPQLEQQICRSILQDPTSTTGPTRWFKTTDFYAQWLTGGVTYRFRPRVPPRAHTG
jgi:hypothetical protein